MKQSKTACSKRALFIMIVLMMASNTAMGAAVTIPPLDAGTLTSKEREKDVLMPELGSGNGDISVSEPEKPEMSMSAEVKIKVNGFRITGQEIYPESSLQ